MTEPLADGLGLAAPGLVAWFWHGNKREGVIGLKCCDSHHDHHTMPPIRLPPLTPDVKIRRLPWSKVPSAPFSVKGEKRAAAGIHLCSSWLSLYINTEGKNPWTQWCFLERKVIC